MAQFEHVFQTEVKKREAHPKRVTKWIHYTRLKDNPKQYRKGKTEEERQAIRQREEALADLIDADGEVLQDLLVRKTDTDEYEILAGHHRRNACKILVEERKKEQYAMLPCILRNVSDARAEFSLYSTNGYHNKSDYEILCELEGMKHLLETYPEEFPHLKTGRMVERLAKQLGMKKTTVGEYLAIAKNLGEKGMEAFSQGTLKKSAAVELSSLPMQEQDALLAQGKLTHKEVKAYKNQRNARQERPDPKEAAQIPEEPEQIPEEKQLPGQMDLRKDFPETIPKPEEPDSPAGEKEEKARDLPEAGEAPDIRAFLDNCHTWPLWCENQQTEETYYRYDLPDGSAVVVRVHLQTADRDPQEDSQQKTCFLLKKDTRHFHDAKSSPDEIEKHLKKALH